MSYKVGILGGTFDPPHHGHLMIAQEVMVELSLDEVRFMPTQLPPHKKGTITSGEMRIEMLRLATNDNDRFFIETIEFKRTGPSYTFDTMKLLINKEPLTTFYFIIGADMVEYLPKWYKVDELVKMVQFVGLKRPGYKLSLQFPLIEVEVPPFAISSSTLRKRFADGKNTKYYLPENVRNFIKENELYG
jgi:nicotinate-nucleotide adenylyltransferase